MTTSPSLDGKSALFSPLTLRGLTLPNRVVISPMCQYSAHDGLANDWHLVHLGKFALGGAGTIIVEATAVSEEGRISAADIGLWDDSQIAPLRRVTDFLKQHGSVPAIQIGHAGRKGSSQRPWHGNGPLTEQDLAHGDTAWQTVSASAIPVAEGWPTPVELTAQDIERICMNFRDAASRALAAGFEVVEIHAAHGYLLHQFLSPIANQRTDAFGGSRENRMRFALMVAEAVRSVWPENLPVFARISAVDGIIQDGIDQGWSLDDSFVFTQALKELGIDVIDCSSGGIGGAMTAARVKRDLGFQVPFATEVRRTVDIPTIAVGLIIDPDQANDIVASGRADLIAIGREALYNPFWPLHAQRHLTASADRTYDDWSEQYGWWLDRRQFILDSIEKG